MLPISLYFFGEISLVGIFLNLVILPTVGIILESGVFAMLVGCVSIQAAKVVIYPGRILGRFYEMLCRAAGNLPGAVWIGGQPRLCQLAVYYGILTGALLLLKKRKGRISFLLLMISAIFLLTWQKKADFPITCLDVGQGDCLVLETATGNCFLVDGGSTNRSKTGQYQILPYLKSQGMERWMES
ncbi:MAG: ComEC/Rec2 family competence protein [Blautia sp.]